MRRPGMCVLFVALTGCASATVESDVGDASVPVDMPGSACPGRDLQTDPMNCGACDHACRLDHASRVACSAGECVVASCVPGYYDVDGKGANGCECRPEPAESPTSSTCGGAAPLFPIEDTTPSKLEIGGNLVPLGDEDWYLVDARDDTEQDGACDTYHLKITFASNPGDRYRFDVFTECGRQAGCAEGESATGLTVYEWDSNGAPGGGQCPCYAQDPPAGAHLCKDDSQQLRVRVFRPDGASYTCDDYKLLITNG